jgi:5-methylcytosine-specific restriction protein A
MEIEVSNKNISLEKIANKIKSKFIRKRLITIETKQYYRDPDISSYAKKRANGKCDCCGRLAPFNRDDGTPFLETHHLIPLSEGGNDSIDNVCALCPNCHRMLHYGKNILEITQIIKNKLIY